MNLAKIMSLLLVTTISIGALVTGASAADNGKKNQNGGKKASASAGHRNNLKAKAFTFDGEEVIFAPPGLAKGKNNPHKETKPADVEVEIETKEKECKPICDYFDNQGINGQVDPEILDQYAEQAAQWDVSVGHTKLILRVLSAYPDMTDTQVLELSVPEMLELLQDNEGNGDVTAELKAEYRTAFEALKKEYEEFSILRTEMQTLKKQLKGNLTIAEQEAIQAQIAGKEAVMKAIDEEYCNKFAELKETFREASKAAREENRKENCPNNGKNQTQNNGNKQHQNNGKKSQ